MAFERHIWSRLDIAFNFRLAFLTNFVDMILKDEGFSKLYQIQVNP